MGAANSISNAMGAKRNEGSQVNSTVKTIIFWVIILACLVLLWNVVQKNTGTGKDREVPFSQFLTDASKGR